MEQSRLLSHCAAIVLQAQPLLSLQLLRLALLLAPREALALQIAKEVFRRRGRFAAEQRVSELLATLTNASAVSPAPLEMSVGSTQTRTTISTSLSPFSEVAEDSHKINDSESAAVAVSVAQVEIDWLTPEEIHSAVPSVEPSPPPPPPPPAEESPPVIDFIPAEPAANSDAAQPSAGGDVFVQFLKQGSYDLDLQKLSAGFSPNFAGLVAYVNLLFTMRLLEEHEKANALIILYRTIKEKDDKSGAEELFDRLFMQRKAQKEE